MLCTDGTNYNTYWWYTTGWPSSKKLLQRLFHYPMCSLTSQASYDDVNDLMVGNTTTKLNENRDSTLWQSRLECCTILYRILIIVDRCLHCLLHVPRSVLILGTLRLGEQCCLRNVVESDTERLPSVPRSEARSQWPQFLKTISRCKRLWNDGWRHRQQ